VGQHLEAILIMTEGMWAGVNFEHNLVDGCLRIVQCDADFCHQLSICSSAEKNSTNTSWPVTETSGCVLTSRQQNEPYNSLPPGITAECRNVQMCFTKIFIVSLVPINYSRT
jgi:hypothetical protein